MANVRQFMAARTGAWKGKALPYDYLVKYLYCVRGVDYDSDNFDSGIVSENEVGMKLEVERIIDTDTDAPMLGVRDNTISDGRFFVGGWSIGGVPSHYFGWGGRTDVAGLQLGEIYSIGLNFKNSRMMTLNDSAVSAISSIWNLKKIPIRIPCYTYTNNAGVITNIASSKYYRFYRIEISKGHEVVRNYVPCVKDGEVCMFDSINFELKRFERGGVDIYSGPRV